MEKQDLGDSKRTGSLEELHGENIKAAGAQRDGAAPKHRQDSQIAWSISGVWQHTITRHERISRRDGDEIERPLQAQPAMKDRYHGHGPWGAGDSKLRGSSTGPQRAKGRTWLDCNAGQRRPWRFTAFRLNAGWGVRGAPAAAAMKTQSQTETETANQTAARTATQTQT